MAADLSVESNEEYKSRIAVELRELILNKITKPYCEELLPADTGGLLSNGLKKSTNRNTKKQKGKSTPRRRSSMDFKIQKSLRRSMDDMNKSSEYFHMSKHLVATPQNQGDVVENIASQHPNTMLFQRSTNALSIERLAQPSVSAPAFDDTLPALIQGGDMFGHTFGGQVDDLAGDADRQNPPPLFRLSKLLYNENSGEFDARSEAFVFAPRPGKSSINATLGVSPVENSVVVENHSVAQVHAVVSVDSTGRASICDFGNSPSGTTVTPAAIGAESVLLCGGSLDLTVGDSFVVGDVRRATCVFILEVKRHHNKQRFFSKYGTAPEEHDLENECDELSKSVGLPNSKVRRDDAKNSVSSSLTRLPKATDSLVDHLLGTFPPPRPNLFRSSDAASFSEDTARRLTVRSAYLQYGQVKAELRDRLKAALLDRSNLFHEFRARHIGPLALKYTKCKLERAMIRWFANTQKEHCDQRSLFKRLGTIMRVHMMRRSFETWKQLSSRGNGNYDQVLLYVQKALFFYAWRRKARDYTRMYMVIMRLLTSMEHRVKRAAFNSWLFASAYHWVAQNRTFGLARMMIKNLQRRSFRRWALHVSPRAAEWRVGRGKLTYDLLCVARLRILKVAKRFWRYRVGLEAWWSWAGEMITPDVSDRQAAIERLKQLRQHAHADLFPPAFHLSTQPNIHFHHGDGGEEDSTVMANRQWRDPSWLGAAHYGEDIISYDRGGGAGGLVSGGRDDKAWHLSEFQDKGTLKREGFRAAASAHEQWWYWLTKAQLHCVSMIRSESLSSSLKRSQKPAVSAVEAADEFLARAWSDSPCPSASVWGRDVRVSTRPDGPRLAPRSFQAKSEASAVRRMAKRAQKVSVDRRGGVKWGKLVVWLPGGTRVALDMYSDDSAVGDAETHPVITPVKLNPIIHHRSLHLGEGLPININSDQFHPIPNRPSRAHSPDSPKHVEIEEKLASGILHSAPNQVLYKYSSLVEKDGLQAEEEEVFDDQTISSSVSKVSGHSVGELLLGEQQEPPVGRYDMLAFVDLLKAKGKSLPISRVAKIKAEAHLWHQKAQHMGTSSVNHGGIASLLSVLLACQALELAGASLVSKRIEKLARSKNKKEESVFKVYLRSHSTHFAVEIDHIEDRHLGPDSPRRVGAIKHFNISNWEVAMQLIETLLK